MNDEREGGRRTDRIITHTQFSKTKTQANEINICKTTYNRNIDPCGIIYVLSRGDAEKLSKTLNSNYHLRSRPYHAGLEDDAKKLAHESWRDGTINIIVATIAFGKLILFPYTNKRFPL